MNKTELDQLMQQAASDAVDYAQQQFQQKLDFSTDSITQIDELIGQLAQRHRQKPLTDAEVFTLSNLFGAYLGLVFQKTVGGEWVYHDADQQAPFTSLHYGNREYAFASVVYHKLTINPEVMLREYLRLAIANSTQ